MSDFSRFIDDGEAPVYEFSQACEEMKNVKFIMAESKLRELLMIIATSSRLQKVVAVSAKGFDFGDALANARIRTGRRYSLLPPVGRRDLIAFAVNLLYAFDVHAKSLQDFLEEYYFSTNGINFSFALFVRSIILPLRDSVEAELREEAEGPAPEVRPAAAAPAPAAPAEVVLPSAPALLPDSAVSDLIDRLSRICAEAENGGMSAAELNSLYDVANALANAVKAKDAGMIRTLMTGFSGVVRAGKTAEPLREKTAELDETLRHFGI